MSSQEWPRRHDANNFCTGVTSTTKQSSAVWSSSGTVSRGYWMSLQRRALYSLQLSRDVMSPIRCRHFEMHPIQLLGAPSDIPFITDHLLREQLKEIWKFRVCQSVHPHTFNWINQQDAATSQVYYLSFKYSSTCFGHPHAHHQELQLQ